MRYTDAQYAAALVGALEQKPEKKRAEIIGGFLRLLARNKDTRRLGLILGAAERIRLKKQGLSRVSVTSASPLAKKARDSITGLAGRKAVIEESADPGLLAGIRITIDDEVLIDASGRRRLAEMLQKKNGRQTR